MSAAILEYATIVQRVDLKPRDAVEAFGHAMHLLAHLNGSPETLTESRIWALLGAMHKSLDVNNIIEFFSKTITVPPSSSFHERIFWLLITGKGAKAAHECADANKWDLKSAIEIDDIPLLKKTCKAFSRNTALSPHERAIYGLLSGDMDSVIPLCTSWEAECVARLNAIRFAGSNDYNGVAKALSESVHPNVRDTSQKPLYRVLGVVLSQNITQFLIEEANTLMDYVMMENDDEEDLDWLRVVAHLTIVDGVSNENKLLLHAYIEDLIIEGVLDSVAAYIRFLPSEDQVSIYASVLLRADQDDAARTLQIGLASRFGLDLDKAVTEVVDIKLKDYRSTSISVDSLGPFSELPPATPQDISVIQTFKWLEVTHKWDYAVKVVNETVRFWLLNNRLTAALALYEQFPINKILNLSFAQAYEQTRIELEEHQKLLAFFHLLGKGEPKAALCRVFDLERYLLRIKQDTTRLVYVPYAIIELVRAFKKTSDVFYIMETVLQITKGPLLSDVINRTDRLEELMDLIAGIVRTEARITGREFRIDRHR